MGRRGAPSKMHRIHHVDQRGNRVTVADTVLAMIRRGEFLEVACGAAGIHRDTLDGWLQLAKEARSKSHRHEPLTRHELDCIDFSDAVAEAECTAEVDLGQLIEAAGRNSRVTTTVTTKRVPVAMPDGSISWEEQVETKEVTAPPDAGHLRWRLERRFSARWAQRGSVEVSGPDGGPVVIEGGSGDARALVAELQAYAQGVRDGQASPTREPA